MDKLKLKGIKTKGNFYEIENINFLPNNNYYFLSNDMIKVNFDKSLKNRNNITSIGIANPHFIHLLAEISKYKNKIRVTAIDSNYTQLKHFKLLIDYLKNSNDRIEFVQNLFKIKLSSNAIKLLNRIKPSAKGNVRGGVLKDRYFPIEKQIWEETIFFKDDFVSTYQFKDILKKEAGIKIKARTVGDINTYYATILSGSKKDYDYWPFTLAFGCSFLKTDDDFDIFKRFLIKSDIYYIYGDLSKVTLDILRVNQYKTIIFWASNIFIDYFIQKNQNLGKLREDLFFLGTAEEPNFPELDLLLVQDMRRPIRIPRQIDPNKNRKRKLSVHTKTFSCVEKYLEGSNNIEIINMQNWYKKDRGISKLPNTKYIMAEDFMFKDKKFYDSIFVHILVGHGMPLNRYKLLLKKAITQTNKLIILEHNINSKDFLRRNIGLSIKDIRNILGEELFFEFCPGAKLNDRNLLFVYKGKSK